MTTNTSKCGFRRITKKLNPILMQYYIQNDVIKEIKHANWPSIQELLLITIYHETNILITLLARLVMLNVFFSATSVNAPYTYQKQLLSEIGTSYLGIHLHCVGSSYTKEYNINYCMLCCALYSFRVLHSNSNITIMGQCLQHVPMPRPLPLTIMTTVAI